MAFLLSRMEETGLPISALAARLPRYYRQMGQFAFEHGQLGSIMQALEEAFPNAGTDRCDGLKLILPEGWVHVRASNTEPLLRLAVEAKSESKTNDLYGRVSRLFER
jgi:phosphomannomutase